jgi:hypothetical protein
MPCRTPGLQPGFYFRGDGRQPANVQIPQAVDQDWRNAKEHGSRRRLPLGEFSDGSKGYRQELVHPGRVVRPVLGSIAVVDALLDKLLPAGGIPEIEGEQGERAICHPTPRFVVEKPQPADDLISQTKATPTFRVVHRDHADKSGIPPIPAWPSR